VEPVVIGATLTVNAVKAFVEPVVIGATLTVNAVVGVWQTQCAPHSLGKYFAVFATENLRVRGGEMFCAIRY
jgi:hypothetical protein